jgi:hypothetical protein
MSGITALLPNGATADSMIESLFNEPVLPACFSSVDGGMVEVANILRDKLLEVAKEMPLNDPNLPRLLAHYAFAFYCLQDGSWDETGPTLDLVSLRPILGMGYEQLKEVADFSTLVTKFARALRTPLTSNGLLSAYLGGSVKIVEDDQQIELNLNALVMLFWVVTVSRNISCASLSMLTLVERFELPKH